MSSFVIGISSFVIEVILLNIGYFFGRAMDLKLIYYSRNLTDLVSGYFYRSKYLSLDNLGKQAKNLRSASQAHKLNSMENKSQLDIHEQDDLVLLRILVETVGGFVLAK